jgi:hypothetical protein
MLRDMLDSTHAGLQKDRSGFVDYPVAARLTRDSTRYLLVKSWCSTIRAANVDTVQSGGLEPGWESRQVCVLL